MGRICAGVTTSGRKCRRKPRKGKPTCGVCKGPAHASTASTPALRPAEAAADIERLRLSDRDAGIGRRLRQDIRDNDWWPDELCDAITEGGTPLEEANRLIAADPNGLTPQQHVTLADIRDRAAQRVLNISEAAAFSHIHRKRLQVIADGCYLPIFEYPEPMEAAIEAAAQNGPDDWYQHAPSFDNEPWSAAAENVDRLLFGCGPHAGQAASVLHSHQTVFGSHEVLFYEEADRAWREYWEGTLPDRWEDVYL